MFCSLCSLNKGPYIVSLYVLLDTVSSETDRWSLLLSYYYINCFVLSHSQQIKVNDMYVEDHTYMRHLYRAWFSISRRYSILPKNLYTNHHRNHHPTAKSIKQKLCWKRKIRCSITLQDFFAAPYAYIFLDSKNKCKNSIRKFKLCSHTLSVRFSGIEGFLISISGIIYILIPLDNLDKGYYRLIDRGTD